MNDESTPLDKPVTQMTRPAKGVVDDGTCKGEEAGDIGSNGCKPLNEGSEDENSLEHPLPLTTSTLPSPPITATRFLLHRKQKHQSIHHSAIENPKGNTQTQKQPNTKIKLTFHDRELK